MQKGTFQWALTMLQQGHKVCRPSFGVGHYVELGKTKDHEYMIDGIDVFVSKIELPNGEVLREHYCWAVEYSNVLATDWKLYKSLGGK